MSDTNITAPSVPAAPSPFAAAYVQTFGARGALVRMAENGAAARAIYIGARDMRSALPVGHPAEETFLCSEIQARGTLVAALEMLTEVAMLVAELLPEGE